MQKNEEKAENKIQQEIVMYFRNTYCLAHHEPRAMIFSVPNEGGGAASAKLIQTGLLPGCADLVVIRNSWHGANRIDFFEVKSETGIQSPNQKRFEAHAKQMEIPYHIVRSLSDFKSIIEK